MRWTPAIELDCPDDVGTDVIETFIDPDHRQDCQEALRTTHDLLTGSPRDKW